MRATSIIFLILSVVLALVGIMTCAIGSAMADEQGIVLFDQIADENDNLIYTYNYANDGIKKVSIDVADADVCIYGGSESAYIELVNFTKGTYDLSSTNLTLSVVDNSSLLKLFSISSDGINFDGFRHYLKSFDFGDKPRAINIYLPTDGAIKQFDIKLAGGDLHFTDATLDADLTAEIGEGNITLERFNTASDLSLNLEKGAVHFDTVASRTLVLEAAEAEVELNEYATAEGITVELVRGDIYLNPVQVDYAGHTVQLSAPNGTVNYFGETIDGGYDVIGTNEGAYTVALTTEDGDITVK